LFDVRARDTNSKPIKLSDIVIERVDKFQYLGSNCTKNDRTDEDVTARTIQLNLFFINSKRHLKILEMFFDNNMKSVFLYSYQPTTYEGVIAKESYE
jgi:hypothetical protein